MSANTAQVDYWNARAGESWAEFQSSLDRHLGPLGEAGIAALAPRPGERIIDVGCGCGDTAVALAERVAPGGRVLGADISRPMLEVARLRAAGRPELALDLREGDVQTADFGEAGWDAVFSRFGVMFFADPPAAFANLRRALAPGGRLAFICWRPLAETPWMKEALDAALPLLPPLPPGDPAAPGPFAFQDPGRVRAILAGAGYDGIGIEPLDRLIGGQTLDQTRRLMFRVGPLAAALRENPDRIEPVTAAVRERLERHMTEGKVWLRAGIWVVTARRPA